eukprot:TRINITY_DN10698_c0_g1_i1.p1 TRINITY_DN10698_c0_g1~~TRINITY_DN10698_c0_g1_i1.p1  ORF type:complete len:1096 (+),score=214.26 TRINITY_DN10698_c0_g1_i1:87-3374(+)
MQGRGVSATAVTALKRLITQRRVPPTPRDAWEVVQELQRVPHDQRAGFAEEVQTFVGRVPVWRAADVERVLPPLAACRVVPPESLVAAAAVKARHLAPGKLVDIIEALPRHMPHALELLRATAERCAAAGGPGADWAQCRRLLGYFPPGQVPAAFADHAAAVLQRRVASSGDEHLSISSLSHRFLHRPVIHSARALGPKDALKALQCGALRDCLTSRALGELVHVALSAAPSAACAAPVQAQLSTAERMAASNDMVQLLGGAPPGGGEIPPQHCVHSVAPPVPPPLAPRKVATSIVLIEAVSRCRASADVQRAAGFHVEALIRTLPWDALKLQQALAVVRACNRAGVVCCELLSAVTDAVSADRPLKNFDEMKDVALLIHAVAVAASNAGRRAQTAAVRAVAAAWHDVVHAVPGVVAKAVAGMATQAVVFEKGCVPPILWVMRGCEVLGQPLPSSIVSAVSVLTKTYARRSFGIELATRAAACDAASERPSVCMEALAKGFALQCLATPSILTSLSTTAVAKTASLVGDVLGSDERGIMRGVLQDITGRGDRGALSDRVVIFRAAAKAGVSADVLKAAVDGVLHIKADGAALRDLPPRIFRMLLTAMMAGMIRHDELAERATQRLEAEVEALRAALSAGPRANLAACQAMRAGPLPRVLDFAVWSAAHGEADRVQFCEEWGGGADAATMPSLCVRGVAEGLFALARVQHRPRALYLSAAEVFTAQEMLPPDVAVSVLWAYARQGETGPRNALSALAQHVAHFGLRRLPKAADYARLVWAVQKLKLSGRVIDVVAEEIEARCAAEPNEVRRFFSHPTTTTRLLQSVANARGIAAGFVERVLQHPNTFPGQGRAWDAQWTGSAISSLCMASLLVDVKPQPVHVHVFRLLRAEAPAMLPRIRPGDACAILRFAAEHHTAFVSLCDGDAAVVDGVGCALLEHLSAYPVAKSVEPPVAVLLLAAAVLFASTLPREVKVFTSGLGRAVADTGAIYRMTPSQCVGVLTSYAKVHLPSPRLHLQLCLRLSQPHFVLRQDYLADAVWAAAVLRLVGTPQAAQFWEALPSKRGNAAFTDAEEDTIRWALRIAEVDIPLLPPCPAP